MVELVTIRVRPGETIRFPSLCVACGQPSRERLKLRKQRGQITRRVDAPLCAECARLLAQRSGQEERFLRLSWLAAVAVGFVLGILVLIALPLNPVLARLAVAAAFGLAGGALVRWAIARRAESAELPEKSAVREATRIVDFTWRDMTLQFANAGIAGLVREFNDAAVVAPLDVTGTAAGQELAGAEPAPAAGQTTIE